MDFYFIQPPLFFVQPCKNNVQRYPTITTTSNRHINNTRIYILLKINILLLLYRVSLLCFFYIVGRLDGWTGMLQYFFHFFCSVFDWFKIILFIQLFSYVYVLNLSFYVIKHICIIGTKKHPPWCVGGCFFVVSVVLNISRLLLVSHIS